MQAYLRLFLLLLLSFALPLNGMASMGAFAEPCPMEQQGVAMDDMPTMDGMQGSCCDDQQEQPGVSKTCKSGHECKTGCALQVAVMKASIVPSSQTALLFSLDFVPSPTPFGVWRPPRA